MKILAFDTSTAFLSIALLEGEKAVSEFHENVGVRHSELLIPTIKGVMEKTGWRMRDIGLIAVGTGPGSFTGLRIGVAAVKGFSMVLGAEVMGVPTMDAIAVNFFSEDTFVAPLLNARKGKVYSCRYKWSAGEPVRMSDYLLVAASDLLLATKEMTIFVGDAILDHRAELDAHPMAKYTEGGAWYPRAVQVGRLALRRMGRRERDALSLEPLYLHAKECNITCRKKS